MGCGVVAGAAPAFASSGIDSPEAGVVQMGRGSAWLARADDPLAFFFNPAAMAFQASSFHIGAQLLFSKTCFSREILQPGTSTGVPIAPGGAAPTPLLPGQPNPGDGSIPPQDKVCTPGSPFPVPQIAGVIRVADRVAIGFGIVTPHASGANSYPESLSYTNAAGIQVTEPSPQRYLLVSSSALIVYPTISVAYAPLDNLSFGAGFVWGIGTADFTTFSETTSMAPATMNTPYTDNFSADAKAELKAKDFFIPGVILSALWMPTPRLDVAAWFKWQDALKASADVTLTSGYWASSGKPAGNIVPCGANAAQMMYPCNQISYQGAGQLNVQIPMEAKLGIRYHHPRVNPSQPTWASVQGRKVRDPMSQDVFDVEVDFTYANNSALQDLGLTFGPPVAGQTYTNYCVASTGTCVGHVPVNGSIPHHWKDVVGVRVGADYVALPDRLSVRAGGFYETKGVDDAYLNLDFDEAEKIGLSAGLTVRVSRFDISAGYAHTFYGTLNNNGKGSVYALSGDSTGANATPTTCTPGGNTSPTPPVAGCYRSYQNVNGGILTSQLNEFGLAGTVHF